MRPTPSCDAAGRTLLSCCAALYGLRDSCRSCCTLLTFVLIVLTGTREEVARRIRRVVLTMRHWYALLHGLFLIISDRCARRIAPIQSLDHMAESLAHLQMAHTSNNSTSDVRRDQRRGRTATVSMRVWCTQTLALAISNSLASSEMAVATEWLARR